MNRDQFLARLALGPVSNLASADPVERTITPDARSKAVQYLNDGLLKLYTRFVLRESSLFLLVQPGTASYRFSSVHAVSRSSSGGQGPWYILDSGDAPYLDDHVRTLRVYSADGCELPLNDSSSCASVFTPSPQELQVPWATSQQVLSVAYQARHRLVTDGMSEGSNLEIDLPSVLEDALTAFVASRMFSDVNGQENLTKSQELMSRYDSTCLEVEAFDLVSSSGSTSRDDQFSKRGWV